MADSSSSPTSAPKDAAAASSSAGARHRAPEQTVHMSVLGRDASDLEQQPSTTTTANNTTKNDDSNARKSPPGRSNRRVVGASAAGPRVEPTMNNNNNNSLHSGGSSHSQQQTAPARALSPTTTLPASTNAGLSSSSHHSKSPKSAATKTAAAPAPLSVSQIDTPPMTKQVGKSWLSRLSWGGGNEADDVHTTDYECLEAPDLATQPNNKRRMNKKISPATTMDTAASTAASAAIPGDSNGSTSSNATVEDQLKQDCTFFYQGMQNINTPDNIRGRDRKMQVNTELQQAQRRRRPLPTSSLAAMSRRRVMSSRDGALFMNKYEHLNQDMTFGDSDEESDDGRHQYRNHRNDLFLDEEVEFGSSPTSSYHEHNPGPTNNVVTDGLRTSSLFYEQDGRVLMRLPRDQVRLIMDPDLRPGVLSVEQWRTKAEMEQEYAAVQEQLEAGEQQQQQGMIDPLTTNGGGQQPISDELETTKVVGVLSNMHELHYAFTVPDDLYRRVVSEISAEAFPPYWGFFKCCNQDSDHADIKLAVVILSVVMLFLLMGSIEWPTD